MEIIKLSDCQAEFNGYKFRKDKKTGYYLSSKKINGKRYRLHVYVWTYYNCEVPNGYQVHHIDGNKDNNDISNLKLLNNREHQKYHRTIYNKNNRDKVLRNLREKATTASKEWHKSEEGRKFHSELAKNSWLKRKENTYKCTNCGKEFKTKYVYSKNSNTFCCNNCKASYRRKMIKCQNM